MVWACQWDISMACGRRKLMAFAWGLTNQSNISQTLNKEIRTFWNIWEWQLLGQVPWPLRRVKAMFCDDAENAACLQSKESSREGGGKSKKQEPCWRTQRITAVATMWRALNSSLVRCQKNWIESSLVLDEVGTGVNVFMRLKDWSIFSIVGYNFA